MKLYSKRIVPQKMKSMYLIESLIRISDDEQYTISLLNKYGQRYEKYVHRKEKIIVI